MGMKTEMVPVIGGTFGLVKKKRKLHHKLRDLEVEMLRMVCNGIETEPVSQDITGEELNRGASTAPNARLDIVARGFWERQRSAFFDVRICHPNADSYRDMNLIKTRFTGNMKLRRSASTQAEFWKWSKLHSRH